MPNAKPVPPPPPALTVIYTDPHSGLLCRASYWIARPTWDGKPGGPCLIVEERTTDAHGAEQWGNPGGSGMVIDRVLAHLLYRCANKEGPIAIDYSGVAIPVHPGP